VRRPGDDPAGDGRGTFSAPEVTVVKLSEPSPTAGGLDWADAGIGAGGMLGLVLVGAGSALLITRRMHDRPAHRRTAISG